MQGAIQSDSTAAEAEEIPYRPQGGQEGRGGGSGTGGQEGTGGRGTSWGQVGSGQHRKQRISSIAAICESQLWDSSLILALWKFCHL